MLKKWSDKVLPECIYILLPVYLPILTSPIGTDPRKGSNDSNTLDSDQKCIDKILLHLIA